MKLSRKQVRRKTHATPELLFEDQQLTSFAGLFLFQLLFQKLDLRRRLGSVFRHLRSSRAYDHALAVLGLSVHLLLGFRQLRDLRYYRDDPMVQRVLGLERLPDSPPGQRPRFQRSTGFHPRLHHLSAQGPAWRPPRGPDGRCLLQ